MELILDEVLMKEVKTNLPSLLNELMLVTKFT